MISADFEKQLRFLVEADRMKNVLRQTLIADGSRRETDAEHSWHFALMAMTLFDHAKEKDKIDLDRVIRMALVHDLVEVYAGDTFCYDVAADGNDLAALVVFLEPAYDNGGIETAGISQYNFFCHGNSS